MTWESKAKNIKIVADNISVNRLNCFSFNDIANMTKLFKALVTAMLLTIYVTNDLRLNPHDYIFFLKWSFRTKTIAVQMSILAMFQV